MPSMKGGAVKEARSPLNEAIDLGDSQHGFDNNRGDFYCLTLRNEDQEPLFAAETPAPSSFDEDITGRKRLD